MGGRNAAFFYWKNNGISMQGVKNKGGKVGLIGHNAGVEVKRVLRKWEKM